MKKKKIIIYTTLLVLLLIITASIFLTYQTKKSQLILNLTTEQKLEDFDTLCNILDQGYPFWTEVANAGIDKEVVYSTYRNNVIKSKTDIAFFKELGYFLKEFKGFGHLSILDGYLYGLYTDTISTLNGMQTEQKLENINPLVKVLTNPTSQNTYNLLDQSHTGFRSKIGLKKDYIDTETTIIERDSPPIATKILEENQTAYIQIPSFLITNYERDKKVLTKFFSEISQYPNLIIDLRGNSGGSDNYWINLLAYSNIKKSASSERYFLFKLNETTKPYITSILPNDMIRDFSQIKGNKLFSSYTDKFSNYVVSKITVSPSPNPYAGKIWVLVDENIYSSSENFVIFCKNTGFATLVGTSTGGDGGMDPMLVSLPNSGLITRFSVFYGLNAEGTGNEANGTLPDVLVENSKDALDKCLSLLD